MLETAHETAHKKEVWAEEGVAADAKSAHGANVNTEVLLKICNALDCDTDDIMEFIRDEEVKVPLSTTEIDETK